MGRLGMMACNFRIDNQREYVGGTLARGHLFEDESGTGSHRP